jgi:hypothetical protein
MGGAEWSESGAEWSGIHTVSFSERQKGSVLSAKLHA